VATNIVVSEAFGVVQKRGICKVTGQPYVVEVPTQQYKAWQYGDLIQQAMPQLDDNQREFMMTGITPAEWDQMWAGKGQEQASEKRR
jgi:hypothetical protein